MSETTPDVRKEKDRNDSAWAQGERCHGPGLGQGARNKDNLTHLSFNQKTIYAEDIAHALRGVPEKDFDAIVTFVSGISSPVEITGIWAIFKNLSNVVESDRKEVLRIAKKSLNLSL